MNKYGLMIKSLVLVGLGWSTLSFAPEAKAQFTIPCTINGSSPGVTVSYGCASEYTLNAQYQYLSTGQQSNILGSVTGAEGVIELLRKANDEATKSNEGDRQNMPNADLADRARDIDMEQRRMVERYTRPISAAACREATVGRGMGGAGSSGSAAGASTANTAAAEDILVPKSEDEYLADLTYGDKSKNYCSAMDVKNKIPGCTGAGSLPQANVQTDTLTKGANQAQRLQNYSYEFKKGQPQFDAMIDYLLMARPFPAPTINEKAKDTPDGRRYLILQRRYNSRVLAVTNALISISSESAALPENSYMVKQVWENDETKAAFAEVYPGVQMPARPSEREIIRLNVLRQYTSKVVTEDAAASSPEDLGRRQIELLKMNNYLLLKQKEQQEWTNILLAHQLSTQVDPVTRDKLLSVSGSATQAR